MSRSRVSQEQLERLLAFMEQHRELSSGKHSVFSRFSAGKLWRALAERLNAAPGARKSPDKWCRYWADIKYKSKKKTSQLGGCNDLSEIEERIKNIVGVGTKDCVTRRRSSLEEADCKQEAEDEDFEAETSDPIEVNLAFAEPKVSTDELLAEAAMRSALAAEKQAQAVTQGVELFREFLTSFRQDMNTMQNLAHAMLGRDHRPGP